MFDSIPQAPKHLAPQAVASNSNYKQVVGTLVEDKFDRNPCVGASENCSEGSLLRTFLFTRNQPELFWIDLDDAPYSAIIILRADEQSSEISIPFV